MTYSDYKRVFIIEISDHLFRWSIFIMCYFLKISIIARNWSCLLKGFESLFACFLPVIIIRTLSGFFHLCQRLIFKVRRVRLHVSDTEYKSMSDSEHNLHKRVKGFNYTLETSCNCLSTHITKKIVKIVIVNPLSLKRYMVLYCNLFALSHVYKWPLSRIFMIVSKIDELLRSYPKYSAKSVSKQGEEILVATLVKN